MLHIITPTGKRPEGIALLAGYLNAQSYTGPAVWIVVDDCDPATPMPPLRQDFSLLKIRPGWRWSPGMNTQAASMADGLRFVPNGATLLIMEDDDAYLPEHIATMLSGLQRADLVGEKVARYYNVATRRYKELPSERHASLASTACRGAALAMLRKVCATGSRRIDMDLWHDFPGRKQLLHTANVVGIKGMPGRAGIGVGHLLNFGKPDRHGEVLREWLGVERAAEYRWYARRSQEGEVA